MQSNRPEEERRKGEVCVCVGGGGVCVCGGGRCGGVGRWGGGGVALHASHSIRRSECVLCMLVH